MFTRHPNPISKKVKKKGHGQETTTYKSQQRTRPRMPHAIVHWRRNEHKGGTADAAKEIVACEDRGRVIWVGIGEVVQD